MGDHNLHNLSVLFSDVRSFTTLSEKMSIDDNFAFLNSYLKRMEPKINQNGGFVDKYIGDAIMDRFTDYTRGDAKKTSADNAFNAALEMHKELVVYNEHRKAQGYTPIEFGIGINTGPLMLGTSVAKID